MPNIGAGEIALILIVALLVLGPKQLPELARGVGKFLRAFRRQTEEVRSVVEREFYRMDQEIEKVTSLDPGDQPAGPVPAQPLPYGTGQDLADAPALSGGHPHPGHAPDERNSRHAHPEHGAHPAHSEHDAHASPSSPEERAARAAHARHAAHAAHARHAGQEDLSGHPDDGFSATAAFEPGEDATAAHSAGPPAHATRPAAPPVPEAHATRPTAPPAPSTHPPDLDPDDEHTQTDALKVAAPGTEVTLPRAEKLGGTQPGPHRPGSPGKRGQG